MRSCASTAALLVTCAALSARAQGETRAVEAPQAPATQASERDAQLAAARDAAERRPSLARALYEELLRRDPSDDEARTGIARLDLWAGQAREAERALRDVLSRHPGDAEVRASLVDALARQDRLDEAASEAETGLAAAPGDAQLLLRRARLAHFRGDEAAARADVLAADRAVPGDGEVGVLLDSIRLGEVQELVREEIHPGSDDIHVLDLSLVQAVGRFVVGLRTEQSQRYASVSANRGYNALYAVSAGAQLGRGLAWTLELGFGAPALSVPKRLGRVGLDGPIAGPFSFAASYTLWSFTEVTAHIVQPVVSWAATERLRLDLRYAFTDVVLTNGAASRAAHSLGAGLIFAVQPRLTLSAAYLHGVQLDRGPTPDALIDVSSHFLTAGGDLRLARAAGIRPLYTLELRTRPAPVTIHSLQLALYQRW